MTTTLMRNDSRDLDPTETEILGTVAYVQGEHRQPQFCRIRPTHRSLDNSWLPIAETETIFPDVGLVFWWQPRTHVRKGSLRRFWVEEEATYERGQRHDQFQVRVGTSSLHLEVVSLPDSYNFAVLRRHIASGSLSAVLAPLGRGLIVAPDSQTRYVGLFDLDGGGNDRADETRLQCDVSSGFLRTFELDQSLLQTIVLDGQERVVLRPRAKLPPSSGFFNVQSDADLIKGLANLIRRDASTSEAQIFQKHLVDQSISLLSAAEYGSRDPQRDEARLEAARALEADTQALENEITEIGKILESLPAIQKLSEELRVEEEAKLAIEMFKEREEAQTELAKDLIEALAASKALKGQVDEALDQTRRSVDALMDNAVSILAEHMVVQRLLETKEKPRHKRIAEETHAVPSLGSVDEIWDKVVSTARVRGDDSFVATCSAGLMAGSQIVLLTGLRATSLAKTLSHAIGGGGACIAPVAPTMFAFSDLLNVPVAPIDFIPCYADVLGDFLMEAMGKNHVSVVVLQGVNRAPPENILLELADGTLGLIQSKWLRWRASDGEIRDVSMDGRILFLGTLTDGTAIFPLCDDLSVKLPIVLADREETQAAGQTSAVVPNSVPFEVWQRTSNFEFQDQHPSIKKLISFDRYRALARMLPTYVTNVSGLVGSAQVGVAEAVWALTFGRLEDDKLKEVLGQLQETEARRFMAMVDAGETVRIRRFFSQGDVQ